VWRTRDGRFHVINLPDPTEVFTDRALAAVERLLEEVDDEAVSNLVERAELAVVEHWEPLPIDEELEAPFVDLSAPVELFDREVSSLPELEAAMAAIEPRWRLEVASALEELADRD
jgi:hypothetical protein